MSLAALAVQDALDRAGDRWPLLVILLGMAALWVAAWQHNRNDR